MSDSIEGLPQGGKGGLLALGALLLVGAGALVLWKFQSEELAPKAPKTLPLETPVPVANNAPPPPPPEEAEDEKVPLLNDNETSQKTRKAPPAPSLCASPCTGNATPMLKGALHRRGASARGCYNSALRKNSQLRGKMTVRIRINSQGGVCSAQATGSTLQDSSVTACVVQKFRSANFPPAHGGCVDADIPLSFSPE